MKNWKKVSLKNICLGIYDAPHATPKPSNSGAVFLGIKNITEDGKIDLSNIRYIAENDFFKWTKRVLPKAGDIVFSYEATLNRYAIIPEGFRGCLGRRLGLIRTNTLKVNHKFLFYYFFSEDWRATISQNILFGATVNRVPVGKIPDFKILLPCLDTQDKIAAVLSALDAKIELNNRINAELEAIAKTLYDYWFVQFDFPDENGKPYKSSGGKMVYDQTLKREIPEGWDVRKLADITLYINRGISPKYTDNGGMCVLNQKCIRNQVINFEFARRHLKEISDDNLKLLREGDVLVNSTGVGTLGRIAFVKRLDESKTIVDSHITIVRSDFKIVKKLYFCYSMLNKQTEIERFAQGSTGQVELGKNHLQTLKMLVPEISLQAKFEAIISPFLKEEANLEIQNQQLTQLRDWLLPMLMNGQVTVK